MTAVVTAQTTAIDAAQVMKKICLESEASLDYYALFKVNAEPTGLCALADLPEVVAWVLHSCPDSTPAYLWTGRDTVRKHTPWQASSGKPAVICCHCAHRLS